MKLLAIQETAQFFMLSDSNKINAVVAKGRDA
jgi:hypothetical protein